MSTPGWTRLWALGLVAAAVALMLICAGCSMPPRQMDLLQGFASYEAGRISAITVLAQGNVSKAALHEAAHRAAAWLDGHPVVSREELTSLAWGKFPAEFGPVVEVALESLRLSETEKLVPAKVAKRLRQFIRGVESVAGGEDCIPKPKVLHPDPDDWDHAP